MPPPILCHYSELQGMSTTCVASGIEFRPSVSQLTFWHIRSYSHPSPGSSMHPWTTMGKWAATSPIFATAWSKKFPRRFKQCTSDSVTVLCCKWMQHLQRHNKVMNFIAIRHNYQKFISGRPAEHHPCSGWSRPPPKWAFPPTVKLQNIIFNNTFNETSREPHKSYDRTGWSVRQARG